MYPTQNPYTPLKNSFACFVFLLMPLLFACRPPICPDHPQFVRAQLHGTWNAITIHTNPTILRHWIDRLLDVLLQQGTYQIIRYADHFEIIRTQNDDRLCRLALEARLQEIGLPHLLTKLHAIVVRHNIPLRKSYLYTPPQSYTVDAEQAKTKVTGGNCENTRYRVDLSYWKTISGPHAQENWQEACVLGKKIARWKPCFTPPTRVLYEKRMHKICKE